MKAVLVNFLVVFTLAIIFSGSDGVKPIHSKKDLIESMEAALPYADSWYCFEDAAISIYRASQKASKGETSAEEKAKLAGEIKGLLEKHSADPDIPANLKDHVSESVTHILEAVQAKLMSYFLDFLLNSPRNKPENEVFEKHFKKAHEQLGEHYGKAREEKTSEEYRFFQDFLVRDDKDAFLECLRFCEKSGHLEDPPENGEMLIDIFKAIFESTSHPLVKSALMDELRLSFDDMNEGAETTIAWLKIYFTGMGYKQFLLTDSDSYPHHDHPQHEDDQSHADDQSHSHQDHHLENQQDDSSQGSYESSQSQEANRDYYETHRAYYEEHKNNPELQKFFDDHGYTKYFSDH